MGVTRAMDRERRERTSPVSSEILGLERTARDDETVRLRETRLTQEAANPAPAKPKRTLRKNVRGSQK
jgi:hypothetical protein